MATIRSKGNKATELRVVAMFRTHGISGWRRGSTLPGRPDFVLRAVRLAVFVDGCFWHGCPKHGTKPRTNAAFWRRKIATNKARDRRVNRELRGMGWRVLRIWEHELARKNEGRLLRRLEMLMLPRRTRLPSSVLIRCLGHRGHGARPREGTERSGILKRG